MDDQAPRGRPRAPDAPTFVEPGTAAPFPTFVEEDQPKAPSTNVEPESEPETEPESEPEGEPEPGSGSVTVQAGTGLFLALLLKEIVRR